MCCNHNLAESIKLERQDSHTIVLIDIGTDGALQLLSNSMEITTLGDIWYDGSRSGIG